MLTEHEVRILVPDRGEPTRKIGLLISSCISGFVESHTAILLLQYSKFGYGFRRIQKLPLAQEDKLGKAALSSC